MTFTILKTLKSVSEKKKYQGAKQFKKHQENDWNTNIYVSYLFKKGPLYLT